MTQNALVQFQAGFNSDTVGRNQFGSLFTFLCKGRFNVSRRYARGRRRLPGLRNALVPDASAAHSVQHARDSTVQSRLGVAASLETRGENEISAEQPRCESNKKWTQQVPEFDGKDI